MSGAKGIKSVYILCTIDPYETHLYFTYKYCQYVIHYDMYCHFFDISFKYILYKEPYLMQRFVISRLFILEIFISLIHISISDVEILILTQFLLNV